MKICNQLLIVSLAGAVAGAALVVGEPAWIVAVIAGVFTSVFLCIYGVILVITYIVRSAAAASPHLFKTCYYDRNIGLDIDGNPLMDHHWYNGGK